LKVSQIRKKELCNLVSSLGNKEFAQNREERENSKGKE
jgi:hypothetical protein